MSWGRVLFGFVIMLGVFIAWGLLMKSMRGDGGSGLDLSVGRKKRKAEPVNELERIIAAHRAGDAGATEAAIPLSEPSQGPSIETTAAPPVPALRQAPVFLAGAQKLAYLVFKTGLPDHPLFARVPLGELLPVALVGADLGRHAFTLVVCRPDFTVAAAIDIADPAAAQRMAMVNRTLKVAAIRHIVIETRNMPKPRDVRALVHGD